MLSSEIESSNLLHKLDVSQSARPQTGRLLDFYVGGEPAIGLFARKMRNYYQMCLTRAIGVMFLALGLALGSMIAVASATEQAFAKPCPMHDQGADAPCCKGDCTGAMMGCSVKCSVPYATAAPQSDEALGLRKPLPQIAWACGSYDPFIGRPPPPIPII